MRKKEKIPHLDLKEWKRFLSDKTKLFDKEITNNNKKNFERYRFDLHGLTIDDANNKVYEIINQCYQKKINEILIITGKGSHSKNQDDTYYSKENKILKKSIPYFIKNNADLNSKISKVTQAGRSEGGEGAIVVKLKNKF